MALFWNATTPHTKREQGAPHPQWMITNSAEINGLMRDSLSRIHDLFMLLFKRIFKAAA